MWMDKGVIRGLIKVVKEHNYSLQRSMQSSRTPAILFQTPFILHMGAAILSAQIQRTGGTVSDNECVCEGQGSVSEFPVRSTRAGQTRGIEPGLYSAALYRTALLWRLPPSRSVPLFLSTFHTLFLSQLPPAPQCNPPSPERAHVQPAPALSSLQACELVV